MKLFYRKYGTFPLETEIAGLAHTFQIMSFF